MEIFAVGTETIRRAQNTLSSCEACNEQAELPFDWILDEVTGHRGSGCDYFLTEPARCPRCGAVIIEKTLVQPDGGVFSI